MNDVCIVCVLCMCWVYIVCVLCMHCLCTMHVLCMYSVGHCCGDIIVLGDIVVVEDALVVGDIVVVVVELPQAPEDDPQKR